MHDPRRPWLDSYPDIVPDQIDAHCFENLNDLFDYAVFAFRDRTAYINMKSTMTYRELERDVRNFAAFLQNHWQLKPGDKLAIMMPNLMQYPIALFGAWKAGLTVVNVNPLYTPRELAGQLADSGATAIVVIANYAFNLQKILPKTKIKHVVVTGVGDAFGFFKGTVVNFAVRFLRKMVPSFLMEGSVTFVKALKIGESFPFTEVKAGYDDIALLQYTGGTTGEPKGAMLSHGNIVSNIAQALAMYSSKIEYGAEFMMTAIPLYHIFALTVNCVLFLAVGGTNLLITDPRHMTQMIRDMARYPQLSIFTGVNTLFNAMLNNPEFDKLELKNIKLVVGGGAAVQSGVAKRFYAKTGIQILEGYGLTECSPLCCVNPINITRYTGSIGVPVPSTLARIIDEKGQEIWDLNRPGELEFKGPQVMKGYYNRPEATAAIMHDGYVRTGDIAVWQEGGYIKIIDRLKDMILVSGFNVFPSEIEDVISRFDKIIECAVIGVPSETTGEAIKVYAVRRDPGLTEKELKDYCRKYLTAYKVPKIIEFIEDLPKSAIGKVLRRNLRDMTPLPIEGSTELVARHKEAMLKVDPDEKKEPQESNKAQQDKSA